MNPLLATLLRWCLRIVAVQVLATAATAATTNSAWSMRVWQTGDGLPNNKVSSLAQTPDGYLWVSTESRLARFDGFRFEEFSSVLDAAGRNQCVTALEHGQDGSLWLAMERGAIVNLRAGVARVFTNDLPDLWAETLTEDSAGTCWIAYRDGTVCRLKNGEVTRIKASDGLPVGRFTSFARDTQGRLWFAKGGQVGIFREEHFETLLRLNDLSTHVASARDGGVWICLRTNLYRYEEGGQLQDCGALESDTSAAGIFSMVEDRAGGVWIGTPYNGLFHFDGSRIERVPTSRRNITGLLEDREGNLWVGTAGGGLNRIQPRVVELMATETGAPFEAVDSICEDTNGAVWVAARGGVVARSAGEKWEVVSKSPIWPRGGPSCVTVDRDGAVWIGTVNRRFIRWQDGAFTTSTRTNGIEGQIIHALLASRNGDLWFGEERPDVIQRLRNGQMTTLPLPSAMGATRALVEDSTGNIFVATEKGALFQINGDAMTEIAPQTADASLSIRSLYGTEDGSVWIGYSGAGLGRLKDGQIVHINHAKGLPDDYISQILADGRGWLWFGGDHGIFRVQQKELEAVTEGRIERVRSVLHGPDEGFSSLQANFGFGFPNALRSSDGRLWLPMRNALAVVNRDQVRDDTSPTPVLLTRVAVDDQTVASYGGVMPVGRVTDLRQSAAELRLPPQHRRVEFEFTALNLRGPQNVRFRFRLDGLDDRWSDPDTARSMAYSRLAAGPYRFRVIGCNSSGIWNETETALAFTVAPFFWQTWWFQSTALAALLVAVAGTVRYVSLRRLRERLRVVEQQAALDKERARIAKDLHDDLGASMTQMTLLLELAAQHQAEPEAAAAHVQDGLVAAREAIKSLDAAVWAVNPRNNTLPELVAYLGQFAMEFLQNTNIRCDLDLPDYPPERAVSAELRHNLFLIVKEALNNVVRHAHASQMRLRITVTAESLSLLIEDNGRGFERKPDNALADGLRNMRQRTEEINGQFQIESKPGAGTRVSVEYRWPPIN